MDLRAIREQSLEYLKKWKLPTNPHLPLLDEVHTLRDTTVRAKRVLSMHAAAAVAYGFPKDNVVNWIEAEGLRDYLAPSEVEFIYQQKGDKGQFQIQIEAMRAIAWTLGIVNGLDFRKNCEQSFVTLLPNLKEMESAQRFNDAIKDRPVVEVIESADLAYCLHWSSTQMAIQGNQPSWPVQSYVIIQRRKGLDWVMSQDPWDEVPLDT